MKILVFTNKDFATLIEAKNVIKREHEFTYVDNEDDLSMECENQEYQLILLDNRLFTDKKIKLDLLESIPRDKIRFFFNGMKRSKDQKIEGYSNYDVIVNPDELLKKIEDEKPYIQTNTTSESGNEKMTERNTDTSAANPKNDDQNFYRDSPHSSDRENRSPYPNNERQPYPSDDRRYEFADRGNRSPYPNNERQPYPSDDRYPSNERQRQSYPSDDRRYEFADRGNRSPYPNNERQPYPSDDRYPSNERQRQSYPSDDRRYEFADRGNRSPYPNNERQPYPSDDRYPSNERQRQPYPSDDRYPSNERQRQPYPSDDRYSNNERQRQPYSSDDRGYYSDNHSPRGESFYNDDNHYSDPTFLSQYDDYDAPQRRKPLIISVNSAKGGVGKTLISCELAEFFANSMNGREESNVCIVDYNIEFGDVTQTLGGLDEFKNHQNMMEWLMDIKARVEAGENPDDINYSTEIIRNRYLNRKGSLFALLAPTTHQDTFVIEDDSVMKIMLRNIIEFGNFDYIICDTGNNTRDASYTALEYADVILLILTQDMNTVKDNRRIVAMLSKLNHFDLSKIKIVFNKVSKNTGMRTSDILAYFNNPKNQDETFKIHFLEDQEFECLGEIPKDEKALNNKNHGMSLIMDCRNTPFSKALTNIAFLLVDNDEHLQPIKPKKGFFSKLFGSFKSR